MFIVKSVHAVDLEETETSEFKVLFLAEAITKVLCADQNLVEGEFCLEFTELDEDAHHFDDEDEAIFAQMLCEKLTGEEFEVI